jgi:hypothetical protein
MKPCSSSFSAACIVFLRYACYFPGVLCVDVIHIMYEVLSVNTTIKLTIQVHVYVVFIIITCFDPCGSSSGDGINSSESNTIGTESFVRLTDMDPCECAGRRKF